jgi:hypothetical protein
MMLQERDMETGSTGRASCGLFSDDMALTTSWNEN